MGRDDIKAQPVQSDDAELFLRWIALQTASGKNVLAALILFLIKAIMAFEDTHAHTRTTTRIALNLQTSHANGMCLILERSNLRQLNYF